MVCVGWRTCRRDVADRERTRATSAQGNSQERTGWCIVRPKLRGRNELITKFRDFPIDAGRAAHNLAGSGRNRASPILGRLSSAKSENKPNEPEIENRQARHDYAIDHTLECGIELRGTEIKSVRAGKVSLAEGYVSARSEPVELRLHSVHIAEYPPAGKAVQHEPVRVRNLLAHKKEIRKLAVEVAKKGVTLVPLKIYFKNGRAKLLIGVGTGRKAADKRHAIAKREMDRDMDRAMHKRR
ncbi:MAG: SsrA-binding protein SmpB [Phycisphaerae bacterium]|nr:SsrA-binding protein SmpB [Phycisphaerae bacterium]